jgi:hypothetical protein
LIPRSLLVCELAYKYFRFGGPHIGFPTSGATVQHRIWFH